MFIVVTFFALIFIAGLIMTPFGISLITNNSPYVNYIKTECTLYKISDPYICDANYHHLCYNAIYYVNLIDNFTTHYLINPSQDEIILHNTHDCIYKDSSILLKNEEKYVNIYNIQQGINDGITLVVFGIVFICCLPFGPLILKRLISDDV